MKIKKPKTGEFFKSGFNIIVSHAVSNNVDLDSVFYKVSKLLPNHFTEGLDYVYIGEFSFLKERDLNAMYKEGALFLSNDQDDQDDMIDDIIHEIGHHVEDKHNFFIYSDGTIEREFLSKRKRMYHILEDETQNDYLPNYADFLKIEYDEAFDRYLYQVIGYDHLGLLVSNLFFSPYGSTSIREYFANGFEAYFFHRKIAKLKSLSPKLFNKISKLETLDEN